MPTLQIRDLPDQVYRKLQTDAQKDHRSLSQQALVTLKKGLNLEENPKERRQRLIDHIISNKPPIDVNELEPPEIMVRKDRGR